jgi:hypothetical protein
MEEPLEKRWRKAIEAGLAALEAAARAGAMPAGETGRRRRLLVSERVWVETFDWSALDRRLTVFVLARRRPAGEDLVEKAA